MTCWEVLELEATEDFRAIKRAYAKKLKITRPDDDSKAFEILHNAYKEALRCAEYGIADANNDDEPLEFGGNLDVVAEQLTEALVSFPEGPTQHQEPVTGVNPVEPIVISAQVSGELPEVQEEPTREPIDTSGPLDTVRNLLTSSMNVHKLELWRKLEQDDRWLDEDFRLACGRDILRLILDYQKLATEKKRRYRRLNKSVLAYLDQLGGWRLYFDDLLDEFDYEELEFLYELDGEQTSQQADGYGIKGGGNFQRRTKEAAQNSAMKTYNADLSSRGFAFGIDCVIALGLGVLVETLLGLDYTLEAAGNLTIVAYVLMTCSMELSRFQASLGKLITGCRVTDNGLQRARVYNVLMRGLVTGLILWFAWAVGLVVFDQYLFKAGGVWPLVISVGILLLYLPATGYKTLQDIFTNTLVVEERT